MATMNDKENFCKKDIKLEMLKWALIWEKEMLKSFLQRKIGSV